jgi:Recombination endonuclease VII
MNDGGFQALGTCKKEKEILLFYPLRLTPQPLCRDCANRGKHCSKCKVYKPYHATGDVRGLLCMRCNLLLGMIEKDYDRVEKMFEYIRGGRKEES